MKWLRVEASVPDASLLARAADVLRSGGLVVYPTDTLYGLGADPRLESAAAKVFALKGRAPDQPLPLVAADIVQVEEIAVVSALARRLAALFWPGPLTLVADLRRGLAPGIDAGTRTVAVRVPDHEVARGLAAALGCPVVSTSANTSGQAPPATAIEAISALGARVDLVLDAGAARGGSPSTIVDARGEAPVLIRSGAVPFDTILRALA